MFKTNNVYKTFLFSFLVIALAVLILMLPLTYVFDKKNIEHNVQINEYLIQENVKTIEESIDNAINVIYAFSNSDCLNGFTRDDFNSNQIYYNITDTTEYIASLLNQNLHIDNLSVYVKEYNCMISTHGILTPERYYDVFYFDYDNYDVWYQTIQSEHKLNLHEAKSNSGKKIYYKFDIEKRGADIGEISVIAEISQDIMKKILDDVEVSTISGVALYATESDTYIFSSGIKDRKVITERTKRFGVNLFSKVDKLYNFEYILMCDTFELRKFSVVIWGAFVIISLIVVLGVFYYTRRVSKGKFKSLFELFSKDDFINYKKSANMQIDDFKLMKFYIDMLNRSNKENITWNKFFRLINGLADEETKEAFSKSLKHKKYLVIVVEPHEESWQILWKNQYNSDNIKTIFINIINELFGESYTVVSEQIDNNFCYLFNSEEFEKSDIIKVIENIRLQLQKHFDIHIFTGVGGVKEQLSEISLSYYEALDALSYSKNSDCEEVVFADEIKNKKFSIENCDARKSEIFIGYIECGDYTKAYGIIEDITEAVVGNSPFAKNTKEHISKKMHEILQKVNLCDFINKEDIDTIIDKSNGVESMKKDLYSSIEKNVRGYLEQKRNNRMIQVREYIDNNYSDINLSVSSIADEFGLNSIYMARIFKEYFNENVSSYIKEVRFKHAKRMLIETEEKIENIAEKVGYNKQTFSRTFKNYLGCTPKDFRLRYRR